MLQQYGEHQIFGQGPDTAVIESARMIGKLTSINRFSKKLYFIFFHVHCVHLLQVGVSNP